MNELVKTLLITDMPCFQFIWNRIYFLSFGSLLIQINQSIPLLAKFFHLFNKYLKIPTTFQKLHDISSSQSWMRWSLGLGSSQVSGNYKNMSMMTWGVRGANTREPPGEWFGSTGRTAGLSQDSFGKDAPLESSKQSWREEERKLSSRRRNKDTRQSIV